jgi:hypothetical protein
VSDGRFLCCGGFERPSNVLRTLDAPYDDDHHYNNDYVATYDDHHHDVDYAAQKVCSWRTPDSCRLIFQGKYLDLSGRDY